MAKSNVEWYGIGEANQEQLKSIRDAITCTFEVMHKIEQAKQEYKDIFEAVHEKTGIPRRLFNFLAKDNYKGNGREEVAKNNELEEALDVMDANKLQ